MAKDRAAPGERPQGWGSLRGEGPKTLILQLWGRWLGSAPVSRDGTSNFDLLPLCLLGTGGPNKQDFSVSELTGKICFK